MDAGLSEFAESLMRQKGIYKMSDDAAVLEQMKSDLCDRIEDRVNAAILEHVPPDKLPAFERLLESGSPQDIKRFCRENVKGAAQIVGNAMTAFEKMYLGK